MLQDVIKLKARDPILNDITGENALVLAPQGGDIRAAHVWSEKEKGDMRYVEPLKASSRNTTEGPRRCNTMHAAQD